MRDDESGSTACLRSHGLLRSDLERNVQHHSASPWFRRGFGMSGNALYWYLSIFAWLFFTGIGIPPVPEEAGILYAASVNELHPEVWWGIAWAACGLGIICADCVLYGVGRWWGPKLFQYKWVQKLLSEERRLRLEGRFERHGIKMLLAARFLPPLRTGVFMIAGATRYPFVKFLLADLIYAVVGVGTFFFFGAGLVKFIKQFESIAIGIVGGALMVYGLFLYYRMLRRRELGARYRMPVSILQGSAPGPDEAPTAKNPAAAPAAEREAKAALEGG